MLKSFASKLADVLARFANLKENEWMMQHITLVFTTDARNEESTVNEYLRAAQINLYSWNTFYTAIARIENQIPIFLCVYVVLQCIFLFFQYKLIVS